MTAGVTSFRKESLTCRIERADWRDGSASGFSFPNFLSRSVQSSYVFSIQELYQYVTAVRRRFLEKLGTLPWEFLVENREASFYSIRNIFIHMIDAEDWIVNWVASDRAVEYRRSRKSGEYTSFEMVKEHALAVEKRTQDYFQRITEADLQKRVRFTLSTGETFNMSVEESLFQNLTEQLYHMGELIALLWQQNIEPPNMQWFYNNPRFHV